jgi:internalin A
MTLPALSGCVLSPKNVNYIQFKDPKFAQCIAQTGITELSKINELSCIDKQITHVDEIRYMSALTDLVLIDNELTEFDATVQPNLRRLNLTLMSLNIHDGREQTRTEECIKA